MRSPGDGAAREVTARIATNPLWYHTMELAPGAVTPGWFDLRPIADRLPWPDVRDADCLDVATYDGFFAFELERRGARRVTATDIASHEEWDWLPRDRAHGADYLKKVAGEKGKGFEIAAQALGSTVERRFVNVYELTPETVGVHDVVTCGSLLLHLRDPFRALAAIRSVCSGFFLSVEQVDLRLSLPGRRRPAFALTGDQGQWLVPNVRAHRRALEVAGFQVLQASRPFAEPYGAAHPPTGGRDRLLQRLVLGGPGVPCSAVLCRPDPAAGPVARRDPAGTSSSR